MPPPDPPRVKDGRRMAGYPVRFDRLHGLVHAAHGPAFRSRQPDSPHRLGELGPVLGDPDGPLVGPDQLDPEALERAVAVQGHGHVERGLPAHRGQQRIRPLALDDLRHPFRRDRLDVGPVGHLGVGHDRRRIRVHQDDPVALFLERAHRLRAGVVELGALTNDDRSRSDQENRVQVSPFRHPRVPARSDRVRASASSRSLAGV